MRGMVLRKCLYFNRGRERVERDGFFRHGLLLAQRHHRGTVNLFRYGLELVYCLIMPRFFKCSFFLFAIKAMHHVQFVPTYSYMLHTTR